MSALHRNALLPDALGCLRCGEPVRDAEDYCPACDPSAFDPPPDLAPGFRVLEWVCAALIVAIVLATTVAIGNPVGWLVG